MTGESSTDSGDEFGSIPEPHWPDDDAPTEPIDLRRLAAAGEEFPARPEPEAGAASPESRPPGSHRPEPQRKRADEPASTTSRTARRIGVVVGAVLGVAVLGYVADLAVSSGDVPRGVVVAGVDIGGMDTDEAETRLRSELDGRTDQELTLRIADVETSMVPSRSGLGVDWDRTWERVGGQPLNPLTRIVSLFGTRTVGVASTVDDNVFDRRVDELREHDVPTEEGSVVFEGARPVAVPPVPGRVLDVPAARSKLLDRWMVADEIQLPVVPAPLTVRPEAIEQALHTVAEPAVSAPVEFVGRKDQENPDEISGTLRPEQIAEVISFAPDGEGGLAPRFDQRVATDLLAPQLVGTEIEPKDASFSFTNGSPSVVPSVVGEMIDWPKTLEKLPGLLAAPVGQRTTEAVYHRIEPKLTTDAAEALGVTESMGEFTTDGFSGPSGVNIRTVAEEVDGAVVQPGETFSLNGHTGHRGIAEGYVESGIINNGRPAKAVGGGISQFATTLYNAAYFAGLEDMGHTEHSYYISRYPEAREATVFDGAIDLKFRNNTPNGIYIEAAADSSEVTVRIWGTKTVEVESITGDRSDRTEPETITLPKGDECIASEGAPGFTSSDTRVITDIATGKQLSRSTREVEYDPVPDVECE